MQFYLPGTVTGIDPAKHELVMPIGASELAPVDIEDIAKVAVALMRADGHHGTSYYISGPQALTMTDVVEEISEATATTFRYTDVSFEQKRNELAAAGLPPDALDLLDELFKERRRCTKSTVDLNAHKTFGVEPTTFAQFARRHAPRFSASPARSRRPASTALAARLGPSICRTQGHSCAARKIDRGQRHLSAEPMASRPPGRRACRGVHRRRSLSEWTRGGGAAG
jgi:hypothetical protein